MNSGVCSENTNNPIHKTVQLFYTTTVTSTEELLQVLELQQQNLKQHISEEEKKEQGFVTMSYTQNILEAMHEKLPSIIVKEDDRVIGYALAFAIDDNFSYPSLGSMFKIFKNLTWKNKSLRAYRYYLIGQICIDKKYRGKGFMELLYGKHKEIYQSRFDFVITEISTSNLRSLRAHERIGFTTIHTYRDDLDEWAIVLWDWQ